MEGCLTTYACEDTRSVTSFKDHDSFGQSEVLPDAAIKEHKKATEKGLNLAGASGTLNWLAPRLRRNIAWAVSQTARLVYS
eukprot:4181794-Amphidinium_carterae.1